MPGLKEELRSKIKGNKKFFALILVACFLLISAIFYFIESPIWRPLCVSQSFGTGDDAFSGGGCEIFYGFPFFSRIEGSGGTIIAGKVENSKTTDFYWLGLALNELIALSPALLLAIGITALAKK